MFPTERRAIDGFRVVKIRERHIAEADVPGGRELFKPSVRFRRDVRKLFVDEGKGLTCGLTNMNENLLDRYRICISAIEWILF